MKTCNICNKTLALDMFNQRQSKCKECYKIYIKEYAFNNPSICKKATKKWYSKNKEYSNQKSKEYYINNTEKKQQKVLQLTTSIEPGIYMIKNKITGECYIGQSKMPYQRKATHFFIRKGIANNTNPNLQEAMKQYGPKSFVFGIIEHCKPEQLLEREQYYINLLNPEYNVKNL